MDPKTRWPIGLDHLGAKCSRSPEEKGISLDQGDRKDSHARDEREELWQEPLVQWESKGFSDRSCSPGGARHKTRF